MTDRNLSTAAISELELDHEFFHLVRFDFPAGAVYYSTAPHDITYDSNVYLSNAIISKIPDFTESMKIKPQSVTLDFSGAAQSSHAIPLTNNYKNTDVYIYRYLRSTGETFLVYKGFIDTYSSKENSRAGTSVVSWKISSHWADWETTGGRLLSDENQTALYATDRFMQYSGVTDYVLQYWGKYNAIQQTHVIGGPLNVDQGDIYHTYLQTYSSSILYDAISALQNISGRKSPVGFKLPVAYGQTAFKGTPIFRDVTGVNSENLWVVYALSEGECESLVDVLFDDVSYTDPDISSNVSVTFHSGTTTQAGDTNLLAASTTWAAENRNGYGICYAVVKYTYSDEIWGGGEPEPVFIIEGKKCTPIGGGAKVFTKDPPTILQDYLTDDVYGKGLTTADLDAFAAGSTYAATLVTDHSGGSPTSIARFEFNGMLDAGQSIKKNTESILFSMIAGLPWIAGKYKLVIQRDDDTSVYTFDEDNITGDFDLSDAGINAYANQVYYKFIDGDSTKEDVIYTALSQATIDAEDNGRIVRKDITNNFENNRYRALNRSNTILKSLRDQLKVNLTSGKADSIRIETGDVVDIVRATQGWTGTPIKLFRVTDMKMLRKGGNVFTLEFYDPTNQDWEVNAEYTPPSDTALTNPLDVSAPTSLVMVNDELVTTNNLTVDRIQISFTEPADSFIIHYDVYYKESTDTDYTKLTEVKRGENTCYLANVSESKTYDFEIYAINSLGVRSTALTGSKLYSSLILPPTVLQLTDDAITTSEGTTIDRIKIAFTASTSTNAHHYEVFYKESTDTDYTKLTDILETDTKVCYLYGVAYNRQYDIKVHTHNALSIKSTALTGSGTYGNLPITAWEQIDGENLPDYYSTLGIFYHTFFDSLAGWDTSSGVSISSQSEAVLTGTVEVLSKRIGGSINTLTWDKKRRLRFIFEVGDITNLSTTAYCHLAMGETATGHSFGLAFRYNSGAGTTDCRIYAYDGTTITYGTIFTNTIASATEHEVVVERRALYSYLVNLDGESHGLTTNAPTGTTDAEYIAHASLFAATSTTLTIRDCLFKQEDSL